MSAQASSDPIFVDISSESEPTVIESICINCENQGKTTFLFTRIPFFQEVIVIAFECEICGYKNNELQPAGKLKDQGAHITLKCQNVSDLNRDVIKSEHCTLKITELDFEVPPAKTKGNLNTIEGFLNNVVDDLSLYQEERRQQDPQTALKIDELLIKLKKYQDSEELPFHIELIDPSGNSFIQNPYAPNDDPHIKIKYFNRSLDQIRAMGYNPENTIEEYKDDQSDNGNASNINKSPNKLITAHKVDFNKPLVNEENQTDGPIIFETECHECKMVGENTMCSISIPYFKELIIMAFNCQKCGARSREVKVGGEISSQAKKITLKVESEEDLRRDLFKSETAIIQIPEIELELTLGDVGGLYTTVEGLIQQVHDTMKENNPFSGDSARPDLKLKLENFFLELMNFQSLKRKWTLILDDPLANCFIQNPNYPQEDPSIEVSIYDRTYEQNEELGLNDINTEDY